jgi:membrane protein required for colicin V production
MTWVDFAVLGVLLVSALLAFLRGFVREILGIAAWIGAAWLAMGTFHSLEPPVRRFIPDVAIADPVAFGAIFLVALIVFSLIAGLLGRLARLSALGGLDRSLGIVFGLLRGAALVIAAYIAGGLVTTVDHWPQPVLQARVLPLTYEGARWVRGELPAAYRPAKPEKPPDFGPESAAALMHALPQGYALWRHTGSPPTAGAQESK